MHVARKGWALTLVASVTVAVLGAGCSKSPSASKYCRDQIEMKARMFGKSAELAKLAPDQRAAQLEACEIKVAALKKARPKLYACLSRCQTQWLPKARAKLSQPLKMIKGKAADELAQQARQERVMKLAGDLTTCTKGCTGQ